MFQACFLVAHPSMSDPFFKKSVVLLLEHNEHGSFGFVVNKYANLALGEIFSQNDFMQALDKPAWLGGPVGMESFVVLHREKLAYSTAIEDNRIYFSAHKTATDKMLEFEENNDRSNCHNYRFIVGYSGWGAKQLDKELKQGTWLILPIDDKILFETSPEDMWDDLYLQLGFDPSRFTPNPSHYLL